MKNIFFMLISGICIMAGTKVHSQSIPVGSPVLDNYYRDMQLLGKVDSTLSFSIRPLLTQNITNTQSIFAPDSAFTSKPSYFAKYGVFQVLPFSWQQQVNSDHPYGWNDAAMIPARGYQTLISGGFYVKYGPLSIQFRPEYVYAANSPFNGYASGHELSSYNYHSLIDAPERFGNSAYSKAFLGQSSIRLTFGALSVGLSNENLWWGPGVKNALIISNNAPGFKHLTINTVRPVNIYIGTFEGQIISGLLKNSNYPLLLTTVLPNDGTSLLTQARNETRYFTGFNINYHPKWVPGLTLGLTRTFNAYYNDVKAGGISAYLPYFTPYSKAATPNGIGDPFPRDQQTSLYARWLFTKAHAEVYLEYGLTDNSYSLVDFIGSPDHSRAYTFGVRKMIPINGKPNQYILVGSEVTQIATTIDRLTRPAQGMWYMHGGVTQGDTHNGQVLGSGTGPAGNIQSFEVSWVERLKKIGIGLERLEHDVDFYRVAFGDLNGYSRNWVDFALALHGQWNYKNFLFNAKLQGIKSLNYQWILKDYNPNQYYVPHNDAYNFHGELGITYRF